MPILQTHSHKTWLAAGLLALVLFAVGFGAVQQASAEFSANSPSAKILFEGTMATRAELAALCESGKIGGVTPNITAACAALESMEITVGDMVLPTLDFLMMTAVTQVAQLVMNRIAYDTALYLATGDKGNAPLFFGDTKDGWRNLGNDVASEGLAVLSQSLEVIDIQFNLCAPPDPLVTYGLQVGISSAFQRPRPRCEWRNIKQNYEGYISWLEETEEDPEKKGNELLKSFAKSMRPGQNEVSAAYSINAGIFEEYLTDQRHQWEVASTNEYFKPVTDVITGKVQTPAAVVQAEYQARLQDPYLVRNWQFGKFFSDPSSYAAMLKSTASVFSNTFLSQMTKRVFEGLYKLTADGLPTLDFEAPAEARRQVAEQFSSLLAVTPIGISDYSVLGEFAVCPVTAGAASRNINHCVIDTGLVNALSRSRQDNYMTVKEAMEEGLLHGEYELIPPTDIEKNQDPFCYTYGYCYGNLVKLRKARILPIGWELAAEKNTGEHRADLEEIMRGFDECGPDGIDDDHPWCHLIDPNWVIKYPQTQCRAFANGDILVSPTAALRLSSCVDTPSCINEDNNGNCTGGYGYCLAEKNTWRFPGQACEAQDAGCMAFANTRTGEKKALIFNTLDQGACSAANTGCRWYASEQTEDDDEWKYNADGSRLYFNSKAQSCPSNEAGCTELYRAEISDSPPLQGGARGGFVSVNLVRNPDFSTSRDWVLTAATITDGGLRVTGGTSAQQRNITLASNAFYTLSLSAKAIDESDTMFVDLDLYSVGGGAVNLSGTSFKGDCVRSDNDTYRIQDSVTEDAARFTCTFATPSVPLEASIKLSRSDAGNGIIFDNIQLEVGEDASAYHEGYAGKRDSVFLKTPPEYLNCRGLKSDAEQCKNYAQVCTAQDVGCNIYTPTDGDPAVPAVIGANDSCPNECVGYAAYFPETTDYDTFHDVVNFIADPKYATFCAAEYEGCDSFTNLDTVANGGEGKESFSKLRVCQTPDDAGIKAGVYYTWEGSDNSGYQLKTWRLLKSNLSTQYPCTHWRTDINDSTKEMTLVCEDTEANKVDPTCSGHLDAVGTDTVRGNADCREFYDAQGNIHYRLFSKTVSIDPACHPYRKDVAQRGSCEDTGGAWDTSAGECRYFGLPNSSETRSCPASAVGCRAYTGGAGRNLTTILYEDFENDAEPAGGFEAKGYGTGVSDSNESLLADGHSMRVSFKGNADYGKGSGIDLHVDPYVSRIKPGKRFDLEFWAKGTGSFLPSVASSISTFLPAFTASPIALTPTWKQYTFSTEVPAQLTVGSLSFYVFGDNPDVYFDNIVLKQTQDHVYVVKDSWNVPPVCDASPTGTPSPQHYLGCEEYTDQNGKPETVYQFSRLCSSEKVGCNLFYDTQNSIKNADGSLQPYGETFNARCYGSSATACAYQGQTVCQVAPGQSYCLFHYDGEIVNPPTNILLGDEAVSVSNDMPVYLVENADARCDAEFMGCEALGSPEYAQDKSVTGNFEVVSLLNRPDTYESLLCDEGSLFCEEWGSTADGTFYFKDPLKKACAWKDDVTIGGRRASGWFRVGTNPPEPCDRDYLQGGERYGLWRNGDTDYTGWVGSCSTSADMCTAFRDASEDQEYYFVNNAELRREDRVRGAERCDGQVSRKAGCALLYNGSFSEKSYASGPTYISSTHADELFGREPDALVAPIDCSDPARSEIRLSNGSNIDLCTKRCVYGVSLLDQPEYVKSFIAGAVNDSEYIRADNLVYGGSCLNNSDCAPMRGGSGQVYPGNCQAAGDYRIQNDSNTILKVSRDRECAEWLYCDSARASWNESTGRYETICSSVATCSEAEISQGSTACLQPVQKAPVALDAKAYAARDISWTGVDYSGYTIPNQLPTEHLTQVDLSPDKWCVDATTGQPMLNERYQAPIKCSTNDQCGGTGLCKDVLEPDPGMRLGYAIGSCEVNRNEQGKECQIGYCKDDPTISCSNHGECGTPGAELCVWGYCQQSGLLPATVSPTGMCTSDRQCESQYSVGFICEAGLCVNEAADPETNTHTCFDVADCDSPSGRNAASLDVSCVKDSKNKSGSCFNNECISNQFGDRMVWNETIGSETKSIEMSCRGYPEADAPFAAAGEFGVVKKWNTDGVPGTEPEIDSTPYEYKLGFEGVKTCAPIYVTGTGGKVIATETCSCSYTQVQYGERSEVSKYYPEAYTTEVLNSVCSGGERAGQVCDLKQNSIKPGEDGYEEKKHCGSQGTCIPKRRTDTKFGWQGFCLEKDSSIQIFGSQSEEARPCVTWYPVDQLVGATDLFAKNVEAGYSDGDTFYCAEIQPAYTLKTTGGQGSGGMEQIMGADGQIVQGGDGAGLVACAESEDSGSDCSNDAWDECAANVFCPIGYFAVMGGCKDHGGPDPNNSNLSDGTSVSKTEGEALCEQGSGGDDDCPYFCVPKKSKNKDNVECKTPGNINGIDVQYEYHKNNNAPIADPDRDLGTVNSADLNAEEVYALMGPSFVNALDFYRTCKVPYVTEENIGKYIGGEYPDGTRIGSGSNGIPNLVAESDGFREMKWNIDTFLSCKSVVKVAGTNPEERVAWTDKTWIGKDTVLNTNQREFKYSTKLPQKVFGKAVNIEVNGYENLLEVAACEKQILFPQISNAKGITLPTSIAENGNMSCPSGEPSEDGLEGLQARAYQPAGISESFNVTRGEDRNFAIDLLKQIFPKSISTFLFQERFARVGDYEVGNADGAFDGLLSKYEDIGNDSAQSRTYAWDETEKEGEPPRVTAVGECSGTKCREFDGEQQISVNSKIATQLYSGGGAYGASVSFFMEANKNQLPIKNVIVDWGDSFVDGSRNLQGSPTDNNFYKNQRGLVYENNELTEVCRADADNKGASLDACSTGYVNFTHTYTCTRTRVRGLQDKECEYVRDGSKILKETPCKTGRYVQAPEGVEEQACVFQPRVLVKDNWGWCTGSCPEGPGGDDCYNGQGNIELESRGLDKNECDWGLCPGPRCPNPAADPWVYYKEVIIVAPD